MFEDFWSILSQILLIFEGFDVSVLCLPWVPYGKEDQTMLISNKPNKTFQNQSGVVFLWSPLGVNCYQIIRCNCWIWHLICGQP
jgi:hypothetical protein